MKVLEERCDIITNMEVMVLLVQQQQLLPSVDTLLRCASKPSGSGCTAVTGKPKSECRSGIDTQDSSCGQGESATERVRLEHVKDLLYQHMFNQMVQDYIRKTCPYLHLVRSPSDLRSLPDRSKSQQGMRIPTRRLPGVLLGSRRGSGITALRQGGTSSFISRRCRECLDALAYRFGLTELELLTIMNLGAHKPVEIYVFLEDCSSRFTEDDASTMLTLIDLALVQQQALPPLPEPAKTTVMDVELPDDAHNIRGTAPAEVEVLRRQQEELQEEAKQLDLQQQRVQAAALPPDDRPASAPRHEEFTRQAAAADGSPECSVDLFAPPEPANQPAAEETSPKEKKSRSKTGRTATAKRRAPSRRKRVLDD